MGKMIFCKVIATLLMLGKGSAKVQQDGLCPLVSFRGFGGPGPNNDELDNVLLSTESKTTQELAERLSQSYKLITGIAIEHFNSRDTSVVKELSQIDDCHVHLSDITQLSGKSGIKALWDASKDELPCAVLGPLGQDLSSEVQHLASALNIPQVYDVEEEDDKSEQPTTLSAMLSTHGRARAMVHYLQRPGFERRWLNVLHADTRRQDTVLAQTLRQIGESLGLDVSIYNGSGTSREENETSLDRLQKMKASGIKTIFVGVAPSDLSHLAKILDRFGMLKDEYVYILPSYLGLPDMLDDIYGEQETGSSVDKLLSGALIFDQMDGFHINGDEDAFLKTWRSLHAMLPNDEADENFFQRNLPMYGASYIYDSIMTIGLGGCYQEEVESNPFLIDTETDYHIEGMAKTSFLGASGNVSYEKVGNHYVRDTKDVTVGAYNIRPTQENGKSTDKHSYEAVLTSLWTEESGWEDIEGVTHIFRDGSSRAPQASREASESHYISKPARVLGLLLMGITWAICVSAIALLSYLKAETVIRRAQPFYLQLICGASVITSTTILTLSWDEGAGWNEQQLDAACGLTPWFFFIGQIASVSALFVKLWRVYRVMKTRQRSIPTFKVTIKFFIPVGIVVLILTIWSIVAPMTWQRVWISESPSESFGQCQSTQFGPFFGSLAAFTVYAYLFTLIFALRTKKGIPADFQDHNCIIWSQVVLLQAWLIGPLVMALVNNSISADAIYAWRIVVILVISLCSVVTLVLPKITKALDEHLVLRGGEEKLMRESIFLMQSSKDETGSTHTTSQKSIIGEEEESSVSQQDVLSRNEMPALSQFSTDSIPPPVSSVEINGFWPVKI